MTSSMRVKIFLTLAFAASCIGLCHADAYNDSMFPAAPVAKSAIDFDSHGFLIHGKRTFLVSAGMEYARVPRALWADRLLRLKRAGFNTVEMYTFWNFHEPHEGEFNFSGDHDLDAYLKLIHQMGMYAIVRVGPYCCAEWDSGGYPIWLRFKPGLSVREDNKPFEEAIDKFFDKLLPIVAGNQINKGGSVILVQLENEYPLGWTHVPSEGYGTDISNGYFQNLHDKAVECGIQVPYFFSGMHHGNNPGEYNGGRPLDNPKRPNPWITTEFWSVWFSDYGQAPTNSSDYGSIAATYSRRTWRILANGGNGYNFYMAHGGSNFGYTNCDWDAASYDYGAAVGQAGDLRPSYYVDKRVGLFATSFEDILENSDNDPVGGKGMATNPAVNVLIRVSPAGTINFLDNPAKTAASTAAQAPLETGYANSGTLTLAPGEVMPVVSRFSLCPGVTLTWAPTRILGIARQGQTTTLVAYGPAGSPAELHFAGVKPLLVTAGSDILSPSGNELTLHATFTDGSPKVSSFTSAGVTVRILCVTDTMADHTWFVDSGGVTYVVCGPAYVGDFAASPTDVSLTTEYPWPSRSEPAAYNAATVVYGPFAVNTLSDSGANSFAHNSTLSLAPWQVKSANVAEEPASTTRWMKSESPLQMGSDGDLTADAWYQTSLQTADSGTFIIDFVSAADRLTVFLDGAVVPQDGAPRNSIVFDATAGSHILTVFTAHDGRSDFFPWIGPIATKYAKGLLGPAIFSHLVGTPQPVSGLHALKLPANPGDDALPPTDITGWRDYKSGDSLFSARPGYAWLETQVVVDNSDGKRTSLHCDGINYRGTLFLNGRKLPGYHGVKEPFEIPLDNGVNNIAVLLENNYDTGGISPMTLVTRSGTPTDVTGWSMRGGPGDPASLSGWKLLGASDTFTAPTFYRTTFTAQPPGALGAHPIWRVVSKGLGHGSVWVNGHNLGRYPERIPINGLYIPECWLVSGINSLVIYDEDGRRPDQVTISAEVAASRDVVKLVETH